MPEEKRNSFDIEAEINHYYGRYIMDCYNLQQHARHALACPQYEDRDLKMMELGADDLKDYVQRIRSLYNELEKIKEEEE